MEDLEVRHMSKHVTNNKRRFSHYPCRVLSKPPFFVRAVLVSAEANEAQAACDISFHTLQDGQGNRRPCTSPYSLAGQTSLAKNLFCMRCMPLLNQLPYLSD